MSYRNKTYVAFASEDIRDYRLMTAWRENDNIDFDFINAHDIASALDTSQPETIRRRLRERLSNTKQVIVLGSSRCKSKAALSTSFIYYEIETIVKLDLPVIVANLDGDRTIDKGFIPKRFLDEDYYTLSVSFQPKIIQCALDNHVPAYQSRGGSGPHYYEAETYTRLGL